MVIKTESCFFTELKIFPGHGRRLVRRDGKLLAFIDQKSRSLYHQRKKAQKLRWTQSWRRRNKKGKVEAASKKKGKKQARVFKSIQGITIEDIKKRREVKPDLRKAQREAALREVKERSRKQKEDKKKVKPAGGAAPKKPKTSEFVKVPKSRRTVAAPKAAQGARR